MRALSLAYQKAEHVDDFISLDCQWSELVGVLDHGLGGIQYCRVLYLRNWSHWRNLSHLIPSDESGVIRHMGFAVACL